MGFSNDQISAIEARDKNLLIAAAAGSGKTTVLVARVLGLIKEGVQLDEMLIVTFTRAASADMCEKLRVKLYEMSKEGGQSARIAAEQLEKLEYAQICTIDSFCTDIVRTYFEQADCDPNYRILDEAQDRRMRDEALDEALEAAYAAGIGRLGDNRTPYEVRMLADTLATFLDRLADPDEWIDRALELAKGDGSLWREKVMGGVSHELKRMRIMLEMALEIAKSYDGPDRYIDVLETEIRNLEACAGMPLEELVKVKIFADRLPVIKGESPRKEECAGIRKKAKDIFAELNSLAEYDWDASMADIHEDVPAFETLVAIARDMEHRLWAAKKEISGMTFADLERNTLKILADDDTAAAVRARYKYVFVDEYQDTSDIQEAIVGRIRGDRNLFMVGDMKQSIYRFRGAEPSIFQKNCAEYAKGGENRIIMLRENYRSSPTVLDCVNRIFERVMNGGESEIVYDADARLNFGGSYDREVVPAEILIADKNVPDKKESKAGQEAETTAVNAEADEPDKLELEGTMIARRIHELMDEDPKLQYRDFCILARSGTGFARLSEILHGFGIPAYTDKSEAFFKVFEVQLVMSLLRLVVSGRNDVDILAVLRSPIIGMTTPEIAQLRAENPGVTLWRAMEKSRETSSGCARLIDLIEDARAVAYGKGISRVIRGLLDKTGFYAFVGALEGGARRQGNLDILCGKASAFENDIGGSIADFVDYAANLEDKGDSNGAHELGEGDDVVRIMTDHKSKGLQFKVVFVVELGKGWGGKPTSTQLMLDKQLGYSLMHMDMQLDTRRETIAADAIKRSNKAKERAEELRILYVALTRAETRLIMTGTVGRLSDSVNDWRAQRTDVDGYKNSLDVVCAAAMGCPGAEILGVPVEKGAPEIRVKVFTGEELSKEAAEEARSIASGETAVPATELTDELAWRYPYENRVYAPVKLAVTGLEREFTGGIEIPDIRPAPAFMSGNAKSNPAGRGTAVHQALRNVDYARLRASSDMEACVQAQLEEMAADGRLLPEELKTVSAREIADFFRRDLGRRLLASDEVKREWSFCLRMQASRVNEKYPAENEIFVQGTVDLCFMEDGQWILADYKTNHDSNDEHLAEKYASQLSVYAEALETLTGIKVKETWLCLVSMGHEIRLKTEKWTGKNA